MIGTQIGHLTITRKLGEGAMGAAYLAQHQVLPSLSVVKVLLPQWSQDPSMVQRFINEAKAASSIDHPSIIEVGDCGQLADGTWYITMEYLDGGTLDGFLKSQGGPISMHLAVQILTTATDGLEAAHAVPIVHCDLKPENLYLIRKGTNPHHVVVLDFGVARMTEQLSGMRTAPGMIAGTLAYMAPEQIFDRRTVDRRSDVYALGVITYEMVTGGWLPFQQTDARSAFVELGPTAIYELQRTTPPIDPRKRGAPISDRFASAILAALHFDPARRPHSTRALLLLLAAATPGDGVQPSGIEIVRRYAEHLLDIGNLGETLRGTKPAIASSFSKRYQLGDLLGEGGMAEVYRGLITGTEGFVRPVAIKRIRAGFSSDPGFAQMFVQEAKLVAHLAHPNVVAVLDFDRDDEGRLFLALELVDGVDLDKLMEAGPIPPAVVIFLLSEILSGLGHAHNLRTTGPVLGLVHRDVSPHNVLLSWDGAVKIADFGLAKPREASEASASLLLKGKFGYMSPEQANGNPLDGRSDLFSAGIIAWEMLTGQPLFRHEDNKTAIARVLSRPIPRPSRIAPVPADLEAVVMKLLDRDLLARYATAALALDALAGCADATLRGRVELARLLVERFPHAAASRTPLVYGPATAPVSPMAAAVPPPPTAPVLPPTGKERPVDAPTAPLRSMSPVLLSPPIEAPAVPMPPVPWVPPTLPIDRRSPTSLSIVASEAIPRPTSRSSRSALLAVALSVSAVATLVVFAGSRGFRERHPASSAAPELPPRAETFSPGAAGSAVMVLPVTMRENPTLQDAGVSMDGSVLRARPADAVPIPSAAPWPTSTPNTRPVPARAAAKTTKPTPPSPRAPSDVDDIGGD